MIQTIQKYLDRLGDGDIVAGVSRIISQLVRHIDCMRIFHRFFTSHGVMHSVHILQRILELDDLFNLSLSVDELAILCVASFFHDVGMLPTEDDLEYIRENRQHSDLVLKRIRDIRKLHGAKTRLSEHLSNFMVDFSFLMPDANPKLMDVLLSASAVHTGKSDTKLEDLRHKKNLRFHDCIRPMLLGAVLRLSDELDSGRKRALPDGYYEFNVIPDDQEYDHVKHLVVESMTLRKDSGTVELILDMGRNSTGNIQVLRQIRDLLLKTQKEFNSFMAVLESYGYSTDTKLTIKSIPEDEILSFFAEFETIRQSSLPNGDNFMVLEDDNAILEKLFDARKIFTSKPIKYLIAHSALSRRINWYKTRGANLWSDIRPSDSVPTRMLDEDIAVPLFRDILDLYELPRNYYPDMYVIDLTGVPYGSVQESKRIILRCVHLVLKFCRGEKTLEGRLRPFIVFVDDQRQRLKEHAEIYLDIVKTLEKALHERFKVLY